jgi:predicted PurR-regulated permease PerM
MPPVVPAAISMLVAIALAVLARWLYKPWDGRTPGGPRNSNVWAAILAFLACILCVLSAFLWLRYLVIDYLQHLGGSLD